MGADTKIEWADHTVNFWWGCTFARYAAGDVRDECVRCYAKMMAAIYSKGKATWQPDGARWLRVDAARRELLKHDREAQEAGQRVRVFINSMSDTFEDRADLNGARQSLWDTCTVLTNVDVLLLTKRPGNIRRMVPDAWLIDWPAHVWIGTTAGTQQAANENVPLLLQVPAHVRFLSCEPLLGPVLIAKYDWLTGCGHSAECPGAGQRIHWVICGGESGAGARPMHPTWARALREQCDAAGVAFFFKQWGEWIPEHQEKAESRGSNPDAAAPVRAVHTFADGQRMFRVGKIVAGRKLDGIEHDDAPKFSLV